MRRNFGANKAWSAVDAAVHEDLALDEMQPLLPRLVAARLILRGQRLAGRGDGSGGFGAGFRGEQKNGRNDKRGKARRPETAMHDRK